MCWGWEDRYTVAEANKYSKYKSLLEKKSAIRVRLAYMSISLIVLANNLSRTYFKISCELHTWEESSYPCLGSIQRGKMAIRSWRITKQNWFILVSKISVFAVTIYKIYNKG